MTIKWSLRNIFLFLVFIVMVGWFLWSLRIVSIVYVGKNNYGHNDIVVNGFPVTDKGRMNWFVDNKYNIFRKYNIDPIFLSSIDIWDYGDGFYASYDITTGDPYCFRDMPTPKNCIEKNILLRVKFSQGKIDGYEVGVDATKYKVTQDESMLKK
ncbi:DUF943 family protein [Kluyvera chengduensis]|uniref:DUF943 family protein n=1 Tax=Kluyvera sp. 142359 TaxID=3375726 RepID=UPI003774C68F